jgi:hypothetical protein
MASVPQFLFGDNTEVVHVVQQQQHFQHRDHARRHHHQRLMATAAAAAAAAAQEQQQTNNLRCLQPQQHQKHGEQQMKREFVFVACGLYNLRGISWYLET